MNKGRQIRPQMKKSSKRKPENDHNNKKTQLQKDHSSVEQQIAEQYQLQLEQPIELIDQTFLILDRISKLLNEPGIKSIDEALLARFESVLVEVREGLSLEEMHNLQYSNRLSYILDVSQRKCPKVKNIDQLTKSVESEIERIQNLYIQHFENFTYLQEVRKKYISSQ